jgi:ERCC4-type nuclease
MEKSRSRKKYENLLKTTLSVSKICRVTKHEVQQAKNRPKKRIIGAKYSFIHAVNKAGRNWTETDIKTPCEDLFQWTKFSAPFCKTEI